MPPAPSRPNNWYPPMDRGSSGSSAATNPSRVVAPVTFGRAVSSMGGGRAPAGGPCACGCLTDRRFRDEPEQDAPVPGRAGGGRASSGTKRIRATHNPQRPAPALRRSGTQALRHSGTQYALNKQNSQSN
ncbi:hypothetical protein GCM10010341_55980 [Streptomyces noursei]|nr:hypothetical protein GCM10010341_55980 [Streptomyces noursei]